VSKLNKIEIKLEKDIILVGDILCNVGNISKSTFGSGTVKKVFRFAFNTAFYDFGGTKSEIEETKEKDNK